MKNCSFQNSVSKILWYFFIIPSKLHWIDLTYIILWPKIFMTHIWTIFNKINIYAKKVINKGQISKISSLTHCHFSHEKNSQERKQFSCGDLLLGIFRSFLHSEFLAHFFFLSYHPGLLQYKSHKHHIF